MSVPSSSDVTHAAVCGCFLLADTHCDKEANFLSTAVYRRSLRIGREGTANNLFEDQRAGEVSVGQFVSISAPVVSRESTAPPSGENPSIQDIEHP